MIYELTISDAIKYIDSKGVEWFIFPNTPQYEEYEKWLLNGNKPIPVNPNLISK
jgi:hypothetical protein